MSCCIPGSRGSSNLLKQWKHIWYSSCNWNYDRIKLAIVHCPSPRSICLLHRPDRWAEWGHSGNHQCASFKSLMVALISAVPPGIWYCFWFTIVLGRDSSTDLQFAFPTICPIQEIRESMWGFFQLLDMCVCVCVFYFVHSRTGEITTGWILGTTASLWDGSELKLHWSSHLHNPVLWLVA